MADSGSTRTRRWKLHKSGDHSLCKPGCGRNPPVPRGLVVIPELPAGPGDLDARRSMVRLAERLEAAHEADPSNSAVARELRVTLQALAGQVPPREDVVDRIRAEWEAGGA
jgi:hypothetical protein